MRILEKTSIHAKAGNIVSISINLDCEVSIQTAGLVSSTSGARLTENVNIESAHDA